MDFYCAKLKLVIKVVDGGGCFTQESQAYDAERTAYLEGLGCAWRGYQFRSGAFEAVCGQ